MSSQTKIALLIGGGLAATVGLNYIIGIPARILAAINNTVTGAETTVNQAASSAAADHAGLAASAMSTAPSILEQALSLL
jgi:hypothetical protein